MAGEGDRRAGLALDAAQSRRSRILDLGDGRGGVAVAVLSTIVVFGLLAFLITRAPGWPEVKRTFFDWGEFKASFPEIARAFKLNVKIFCIAEVFILAFALLIAVLRSLPGPVFFPLRLIAIVYADFFRGVPTILVISILALGVPGLELSGVPTSVVFWGIVTLVLIYSAYVSEVYRAGIESVHPSQGASSRALGLTYAQTMRFVIFPQAVRRILPPLLNDFVSLQKDTSLVSILGVIEVVLTAENQQSQDFKFVHLVFAGLIFVALTIPLTRLTDWVARRQGWVNSVGVRRAWRRRGIARALVAESLCVLRGAGMTSAGLGVDAENEHGALGIYEACGFRVARTDRIYRKPL